MAPSSRPGDPEEALLPRLRRAMAELGCGGGDVLALAALLSGAVALTALLWAGARPGPPTHEPEVGSAGGLDLTDPDVVVHVAGQVAAPGLYVLPAGSRVGDALGAAGGLLPDAATEVLNLARPLNDGEQLAVPGRAAEHDHADGAQHAVGAAPASAWRPDGTLDLNRATVAELQELPGIGPVLAQRIVDHREQIGGFGDTAALREVRGIGERIFQSLVDLVAV